MRRKLYIAVSLAGSLLAGCAGLSADDRVFIVGDTAYIDGHAIPKSQYEAAKANGTVGQLAAQLDGKTVAPGRTAGAPAAGVAMSAQATVAAAAPVTAGPHAAVCDTEGVYDTYPGDRTLFSCTEGLGTLTRAQLLAQGWKIDLMERVPAGNGRYAYKLVLSR